MAVNQVERIAEISKEIADAADGVDLDDVLEQLEDLRRSGLIPPERPGLESPHGSGMSRLVT